MQPKGYAIPGVTKERSQDESSLSVLASFFVLLSPWQGGDGRSQSRGSHEGRRVCVKIGIQSSYGREIQQIYTNLTNESADTQNERFWMDL